MLAGAQLGRRLKLPVRTSAVNASPMVDAQSTYETAFSLQAAVLSHSHLINHAAGWLEGGLSASLEKIVVDAELLRNWAEILKPVSFSDDDLAVEAIKDIAAGGHFFGSRAHPGALRDGVLSPAAVGLVELRELARCGLAQRHRARHRHLEEDARRLRAAAARSGREGGRSPPTSRAARASSAPRPERPPPQAPPMSEWIMNARMYAVTPAVEAHGASCSSTSRAMPACALELPALPGAAAARAAVGAARSRARCSCAAFRSRSGSRRSMPLAAPIPRAAWAAGRALYRTDLIVRADAPYRTLEDTFGGRAGWTVAHSQSGLQRLPPRAARLPHAGAAGAVRARCSGNLVTARNVLDAVREGRIDVGPLDAYWHLLIARHAPELTAGIRVLASTPLAPMPAFVAAARRAAPTCSARLRAAFARRATRPWFEPLAELLLLEGFAAGQRGGLRDAAGLGSGGEGGRLRAPA